MRLSWTEMLTNYEIFVGAEEIRSVLWQLKRRRAQLIGRILRHGGLFGRG